MRIEPISPASRLSSLHSLIKRLPDIIACDSKHIFDNVNSGVHFCRLDVQY